MEVVTSNTSREHGLQDPSTPAKLRTGSILHTKDLDSQVQKLHGCAVQKGHQ